MDNSCESTEVSSTILFTVKLSYESTDFSIISIVWFIVFILILQQIEAQLIYPRVVGTSVGLKPFWTLFAIIVGGGLFGIWGMIVGIPLLSVIQSEIIKHADTRKFGVFVEKCDK